MITKVLNFSVSAAAAQAASGEMGWLPIAFVIACIVIAVLLLVIGLLLWKTMFADETRLDAPGKIELNAPVKTSDYANLTDRPVAELNPRSVAASADTVSNKTDDDVVEELKPGLSSQPTVDATGDISVSNDSDDSDEDINVN